LVVGGEEMMRGAIVALALLIVAAGSVHAADEPLAEAKALYAAASFEDALVALGKLDASGAATPGALECKALCLLALGRTAEAQATTAALVVSSPTYRPTETDLSPRYLTLFTETRRKMLPGIAKQLYADARDQFRAKDMAKARTGFQAVLTLTEDPLLRDTPDAGDLRTLASGFLDLAAATPPLPSAASAAPSTTPSAATSATTSTAPAAAPGVANAAAASPAPATVRAPVMTPPVPIRQVLPRWSPPDLATARREYSGVVRVTVGVDGHVSKAVIERPSHPLYDALVLEAARTWLYTPGTQNGQPVEMDKALELQLKSSSWPPTTNH
jgi:hypothetical protein